MDGPDVDHRNISGREAATILAALRFWQGGPRDLGIATNSGEFDQLSGAEIDILCEYLNTRTPIAEDEDTGCAACGHDLDIDVDIIDDAKGVGKDGRLSGIHRRCT